MADSYTPHLNLRKPEVGAAHDTWGGLAGLNGDLDLIDALFLATGLGTSVGLHVGVGKMLNVEGTLVVADSTDISAGFRLDASDITTATVRTLKAPDADGTIALTSDVAALAATGDVRQGIWPVAPPGYVLADGRTIGSASSGATNRANADCEALFSLLWTVMPTLPIYTFEGVASTRGANAAADFAANKQLTIFDARGRVLAGLDNMGGAAAGVLPTWTAMGQSGGVHLVSVSVTGNSSTESASVGVAAGGGPVIVALQNHTHLAGGYNVSTSIVQPTVVINIAVKL